MSNISVASDVSADPTATERRIFEAAKRVFVRKGMDGTSMQEIATEAEISRTSLHYYFRSKKRLFEAVLDDLFARFLPQVEKIVLSKRSFQEKLERFVTVYIDLFLENAYLPSFIMDELNKNPEEVIQRFSREGLMSPRLQGRIQNDLDKLGGSIEASQFMMNLISLCVFPFVVRPLVESFFVNGNPEAFKQFVEMRKTIIVNLLISSAVLTKKGRPRRA